MLNLPTPMYDRILVRKIEVETKTSGGILLPEKVVDQKKLQQKQGEVLSLGCGYRNSDGSITPLRVKVGDNIYFNHFAGVDIPIGDEKLVLMREEEVLGVLPKDPISVNLSDQEKVNEITALFHSMKEILTQNHPGEFALFEWNDKTNNKAEFIICIDTEDKVQKLINARQDDYPRALLKYFVIGIV